MTISNSQVSTTRLLSEAKFFDAYSRWDDGKGRYETWEESVDRVMSMHAVKYSKQLVNSPELAAYFDIAKDAYKAKQVLGAQRALQFGGEQILKNNMKLYNCTSTYVDRVRAFGEIFWALLSGSGVGFSVQKHHVDKLPGIAERKKQPKLFVIEDSIEGWADSALVLISSFFVGGGTHPEFEGRRVYFDTTKVRDKNAFISGGFKAPGPEPLRRALDKVEHMLQGLILRGVKKLEPIHVYDIIMHLSDAVLAGGVRRSATICLFSLDDESMMNAKTGNWFAENPQRARSNNSVVLIRDQVTPEQFAHIMERTKQFGEPGFAFFDSTEFAVNPCFEIGMYPFDFSTGQSGFQGCNLSEINGGKVKTADDFYAACVAAAVLGTIQAGYTHFPYMTEATKNIFEREALLGVSVTGWMNSPDVLFDEEVLRRGAQIVKAVNREMAYLLGINPAARTTCVKPSGTASIILETESGIHGGHSGRYLRNAQMNKESEVAQLIKAIDPYMIEDSVWSANGTDWVISFPVVSPAGTIFKKDLTGVALLEKVRLVQSVWVEEGTDESLCVDPRIRHNVSNTVQVRPDQWDEVESYIFENRFLFSGISFLADSGDKDFAQAPFTEVLTEQEILDRYGVGSMFASGLIVDGLKVFSNLWRAIDVAHSPKIQSQERLDVQADWIRRYKKYADNYFDGDIKRASYCLKDVQLLHRWEKIQQNFKDVDFVNNLSAKRFVDADTLAGAACSGGACELF
jgi:ribonucleoside-diphosphate reductase alpha chain